MTCKRCNQVPPPIATQAEDDFSFPRVIHGLCLKCVVELAKRWAIDEKLRENTT